MSNELQLHTEQQTAVSFATTEAFDHAQRVAKMLSAASLVPDNFKNNIPNTMIALEMANRIGASPLMIMQNMYVVHGKPSWSSQFIISAVNACGRFTQLRFVTEGAGETLSCYATATDRKTGEKLKGVTVTMAMAHAEGWVNKSGSKWKTMPELMIQYRAATFFGRLYAPDILQGMPTNDEVEDFTAIASEEQQQYIASLISTSTFEEHRRRAIEWKMSNGMSQGEAITTIADLKLNQLDPTEYGNYNATDAAKAVKKII
jgi:hypothetical protein